jgi:hypothetical protein
MSIFLCRYSLLAYGAFQSDKIVATNEEKLASKADGADDLVVQAMQTRMLRMEVPLLMISS